MLKLFASSWAVGGLYPLQLRLLLEKGLAQSGWMTWIAQELKLAFPNVRPVCGEPITVIMEKMPVLCAWVSLIYATFWLRFKVCGGMLETPLGALSPSYDSNQSTEQKKCCWSDVCESSGVPLSSPCQNSPQYCGAAVQSLLCWRIQFWDTFPWI